MGLKKSIVFVGAVLVLAACDSATSPSAPVSLHDGPDAALKGKTGPSLPGGPTLMSSCVWVRGGSDSAMVCPE